MKERLEMRREAENNKVWGEKCRMRHEQLWWDLPVPQERWGAWINVDISLKMKGKVTWYDSGRFKAGNFGDMMEWLFRTLELWERRARFSLCRDANPYHRGRLAREGGEIMPGSGLEIKKGRGEELEIYHIRKDGRKMRGHWDSIRF